MAGNIDQAYRTATTLLSWLNKQIAKGNEKMIPASEVYSAIEINFLAGKCDDLAKMMRALPEDPMGDVKNSVNNLRQYKQVLTDAAGRLNTGETAHRISYRMSDRLGWVRFVIEALGRLEQGSGKAAAVVAAAKAVGVKASPDTRHRIAYIATRIRSDIQNGYINIDLASILRALTAENAKGQPPTSNAALARDLAGDLYKLAMWQTGNQMRDLPGKTAEYARGYLVRIIRAVQKDGIPA